MGGVLGQFGVRAIPFAIAAMVLGFILKSAGTQAGPADTLPGPRVSVFRTIHPEIFRLSAPLGSGSASDRRSHCAAPRDVSLDARDESPRKKPLIARIALHGVDPWISFPPGPA